MKGKLLLLLTAIVCYSANAQQINIVDYKEYDRTGYQVSLNAEGDAVDNFMQEFFRGNGKVRKRGEVFNVTGISRADFPFPEVTVYSEIKRNGKNTKAVVWIEDSLIAQEVYSKKLKELWYSFGLDFYKSLAQKNIDESNQALRYAEKQYQRLDKDSLNLQNDIVKNREEKIKLEEALKTNDLNYKVLLQKVENNKYAKDSVIIAIDKIRVLIEHQEAKKRAIE